MPIRYVARRIERFFIYRVLSLDDTPHRIALGVAIGIFITWTPTIGFQMVLTVLLSMLLGANKFVGVPFVWLSNPLTVPVIYGPSFFLGRWILGHKNGTPDFLKVMTLGSNWIERIQNWWTETWKVFLPLWTGSLIVAVLLGVITYFVIYYAVVSFRKQWEHWHQWHRRHHRNKAAAEDSR